jgi:hypothetical protein
MASGQDGVRLEVLGWGGTRRPAVLLAAHVYDYPAATFSGTCLLHHRITRREYGVSSRPKTAYTARRSTDDVLKLLDALKLNALPVLADTT